MVMMMMVWMMMMMWMMKNDVDDNDTGDDWVKAELETTIG